jgi:competence protein ComEC
MGVAAGLLWASAYGAGLFLVSVGVRHLGWPLWMGVAIVGLSLLGTGGLAALVLPHRWRLGPTAAQWLGAGAIALLATLNYGLRYPAPGPLDISHLLQGEAAGAQQVVWGQVQEMPRLTRSDRGQVWLRVTQVRRLDAQGQAFGLNG